MTHAQTHARRQQVADRVSARVFAKLAEAIAPARRTRFAIGCDWSGVVTVTVPGVAWDIDMETFQQRFPGVPITRWYIIEEDGDEAPYDDETGAAEQHEQKP